MRRLFLSAGAAFGFLGVALGAFGAHALKGALSQEMLAIWHTAVEYQFWHALALLGVGALTQDRTDRALNIAGGAFIAGIVIFSGSLYALALTDIRALGAITPIGGLALLAGWAALASAALREKS